MGAATSYGAKWRSRLLAASLLAFGLLSIAGHALAAPPDPIALIQAKEDKAIADMTAVVERYDEYLKRSPTSAAAKTERDKALADIAADAEEARAGILGEMQKHPTDPAVQQAGLEAIAAVNQHESDSSSSVRAAYDAYTSGTSTTTTTTLISLPLPTTTTTTTLPVLLPPPPTSPTTTTTTTATAVPSTSTETPAAVLPGSSTSTTVADGPQPESQQDPPTRSPVGTVTSVGAAQAGISIALSASLPAAVAGPDSALDVGNGTGTSDGGLVEFLRLRLPPVFADPMVDLMMILRAVLAAFTSGIAMMKWPIGAMSFGFLIQQGMRRFRP